MTPIRKMYGYGSQPQTKAILSIATLSDLEIELLLFEYGITNQSPELTLKFPLAKIPALESLNGFKLAEGAAIACYVNSLVPDAGLLGRNAEETDLINQWAHLAGFEIYMDASMIYAGAGLKLLPGYNADISIPVFPALHSSQSCPLFLNNYLEKRPSGLLVNDNITLADIFLAIATEQAGQTTCRTAEREQTYPHIFAHHTKVTSNERIKDVLGGAGFIKEHLVYN
ncbi:glutathione S-transferase C-terminal-like protein [Pisolithus tinctorius]|nr:glutathione S-transferase C-terminal-like protein [Pisolithus tinctorius]